MADTKIEEEKVYSRREIDDIVAKAVAEAVAQVKQPATIVQMAPEEFVTLVYIGQFANGCTVTMPIWGTITMPGGTIDVPKKDFFKGLGLPLNAELVKRRQIIVVCGLTDEEKARFGVDYSADEILTQKAFSSMMDFSQKEICALFKKLCVEHKRIVAQVYHTAYFGATGNSENSDKRVDIDTVKALNKLSKDADKQGMFTDILEDYGRKFAGN